MTYNSAKLTNNMKRDFVLNRLLEKGVTKSQQGIPVHDLDYDELKYELVLLSFSEIDVENDQGRWF